MARTMDIDIRIERQEKKILKLRAQLEEAQDQYDKLDDLIGRMSELIEQRYPERKEETILCVFV